MDLILNNNSKNDPSEINNVKILILGSGPAGLAAALYAARANLEPVVLTGMDLGGQASLTNTIENYPGFPDGVGGQELIGRGVSYCATCDGWFFKDKDVVVVGGGDSALEESLFLTRYAKSITIVHRRDSLRAGVILQQRAHNHPKINFLLGTVITEIIGEEKVTSVKLKNLTTNEASELPVDGVFIFIGHIPNTLIFADALELDERGYIKTDSLLSTNIPGVYVAGEAGDPNFRQVVTSAGMGAAAAMQVVKFLEKHEQNKLVQV